MLTGWSDEAIMSCDLGRLRLAIDAAREAQDELRRFTMRLHGHEVDDPPPPRQSDEEMAESARSMMQRLRRRSDDTHDHDDD